MTIVQSVPRNSRYVTIDSVLACVLRWVTRTAFGRAVVPEVNISTASWFGSNPSRVAGHAEGRVLRHCHQAQLHRREVGRRPEQGILSQDSHALPGSQPKCKQISRQPCSGRFQIIMGAGHITRILEEKIACVHAQCDDFIMPTNNSQIDRMQCFTRY